jgi:hypothetical protein
MEDLHEEVEHDAESHGLLGVHPEWLHEALLQLAISFIASHISDEGD